MPGNRQKIGLILATFHEPELLIFDEPTSGLDPLMQEEFLSLVGEERERGCTVFVSSHDLDEVQRICGRVGMVREGRLIAVERMVDLLGKARRKVSVRLSGPSSLDDLRALPGVTELSVANEHASFEVAGDFDRVLKLSRSSGSPAFSGRSGSTETEPSANGGASFVLALWKRFWLTVRCRL